MTRESKLIPKGVKAIFFDAGGTLFQAYPSVAYHYASVATKHGFVVTENEIANSFKEVWSKHDRVGNLGTGIDDKNERVFWRKIVASVFEPFGDIKDFDKFFTELHELFGRPDIWRLFPDALETLENLKKKYTIGLVSNWDNRLPQICKNLGLDNFFDFKVISSEVGFSKPSAEIFHIALKQGGVLASEALHIGDSLEDDVRGAHNVGIKPIWLDRAKRHSGLSEEEQTFVTVIDNLKELEGERLEKE